MSQLSNLSFKDFCRFVEKQGCNHLRTEGDHLIYVKPGLKRPLVIPRYNPLPEFIVENNLRVLGISKKELREYLKLV